MRKCDVVIIGAGSAGLTALGKLRKHFKNIIMINEGAYGTTCARVGCMPSKLLIQVAEDYHRSQQLFENGMLNSMPEEINTKQVMRYMRSWRDKFVAKTNSPLKNFSDNLINGRAIFINKNTIEVNGERISAEHIIVSVGSKPILPSQWKDLSPNIITSNEIFELEDIPSSLAVIGLGPIGIELGQSLKRLGSTVHGFDLAQTVAGISDPEVLKSAIENIGSEFELSLGHEVSLEKGRDGLIKVSNGLVSIEVEYVLASVGRSSNAIGMGLDQIGVDLDSRGIPIVDNERLNIPGTNIYIVGDANNFRPILHEAADEGRMVSESIIKGEVLAFKRKTPIGVTFTSPNIIFVGKRFSDLNLEETIIGEDHFQMGRNKVIGETGVMRIYSNRKGKILGAEMIGPRSEHLSQFLALAIENELGVRDILQSPIYHPTVEESLRSALRGIAKELGDGYNEEICCLK